MKRAIRSMAASLIVAASGHAATVAAAPIEELYFHQRAGLDAGTYVEHENLQENFSGPLSLSLRDVFSTISWEFPNDPGDPSALNITTYTSDNTPNRQRGLGADPTPDEWNSSDWWTITRLTQTNNVISGEGIPLWEIDAVADFRVFSDAVGGNQISPEDGPNGSFIDHPTHIIHNETLNLNSEADCASTDPGGQGNPLGTLCDDAYQTALLAFADEIIEYNGHKIRLGFRVVPIADAFVATVGDSLYVYTPETGPGTSIVDVQVHWETVPEPGSLALLGLMFAAAGVSLRRRRA